MAAGIDRASPAGAIFRQMLCPASTAATMAASRVAFLARRILPNLSARRLCAVLLWSKCHLAPPPDQHQVLML